MEFGRLPDVSGVDFTLPPDPARNRPLLEGARTAAGPGGCDLRVGLPSWSDPGLVGRLGGKSPAGVLRAHGAAVPSNELNSTFYGYTAERFTRWAADSLPGCSAFRFFPSRESWGSFRSDTMIFPMR